MLETLRAGVVRARAAASRGGFSLGVLRRSGLLRALRPTKVAAFVAKTRTHKLRLGPHLSLILHALNAPDKEALVCGDQRLTFAELDRELNRLASALIEIGVTPGDRVGLMLPNSAESVIAQESLPRLGATAVQIGYRLKAQEIAYILDNAKPTAVLYHRRYADEMRQAIERSGVITEEQLLAVGDPLADEPALGVSYSEALARHTGDATPVVRREVGGGGVIVYTSGTTGKPKGASRDFKQTGLEAVLDLLDAVGAQWGERHLVVCPLYHSAAPAFVKMVYSLGGGVVVHERFDAENVLATIEREQITSAFMVPTQLLRLADDPELVAKYDTSSLRWIMSGAAPLPTPTARRVLELFGDVLFNFYGSTETGLVSLAGPRDHLAKPGTVGRLLRGNEVRIVDDEGEEVEVGEIGELYARNSMLIGGYHGNEQATSAAMRDGFFSVGDLARVDRDGYLFLASRKHDMVISGGVNIYPREIEDHLLSHPAIREVAVVGVPDIDWGESLRAFVVVRQGAEMTESDVVQFCRDGLADFKRPRSVVFLDALPRNPTGKVLKRELREMQA